jgi:hypothetical protein
MALELMIIFDAARGNMHTGQDGNANPAHRINPVSPHYATTSGEGP